MKKIIYPLLLVFLASCSTFSVDTELKDKSSIGAFQRSGVFFRLPKSTVVSEEEYTQNLKYFLEGYHKKTELVFPDNMSKDLIYYQSGYNRFYQTSLKGNYLKFKSLGVLKSYLSKNQDELRRMMKENKLDSLIIYEIYGIYSAGLQFIDFDSVVVLVDSNLQPVFLDHQANGFDVDENDEMIIKKALADKTSVRFLETLENLNIVKVK